ncbi:MAG: ABC-F family ATP-binding cassette domain-containing protein [Jiangellales bacterium]
MAPLNLVNLERVGKAYGRDPVLDEVSLGIAKGERIGVVGRNGGGKSTLLRVLSGVEAPDTGRVSLTAATRVGLLAQRDEHDPSASVRDVVLGDLAAHEWASRPLVRQVLTELLGGFEDAVLERRVGSLSGGERRRMALAALLLDEIDLLVLDEPTNHLDVEAVSWLAEHLRGRRGLALVVVTHDRWFLDAVSDRTWEVGRGSVEEYDGGYSAYVLAKAERARQLGAQEARRQNLLRKELAWLRRGAPARTTKPKFRVDAATALIADEPPPRDGVELLRFAGSRLGRTVLELHDVSLRRGERDLLDRVTWPLGPGDRIALVGANGAGKTTLLQVLTGGLRPDTGRVVEGSTVRSAVLSQHLDELDPSRRVLEAVEDVATHVALAGGRELSASQLCEQLGFGPDRQWTPVGDLSGGERRRLQLTRLLMGGPNVLVLDEPTNDFDVETLTALEDLLDSFAGTLLVVSHDRYFLERVCDSTRAMLGDGSVRHLPGGIDEYLALRRASVAAVSAAAGTTGAAGVGRGESSGAPPTRSSADVRAARKEMARLEREMAAIERDEASVHDEMAAHATDHVRVGELSARMRALAGRKALAEEGWLAAAEVADA